MEFLIKPWDHQERAIALSFKLRDMALLWEVGTGKTSACINILRGRYAAHKRLLRTLIFAPPVVLRNWKREFGMHSRINSHDIVILSNNGGKRLKTLKDAIYDEGTFSYSRPRILVTNYEAVQNKEVYSVLKLWEPEIIVCDEAHRCKDYKGKRANLVCELAEKALHRYILTGTPILNTSMDLFMQYKILDAGETFGKNFFAFRGQFFEDDNAGMPAHIHFPKYIPRAGTYDEFQKRVYRKATRAVKSECLDLPPFTRVTREVELNDEQRRMYNEMRDEYLTYVDKETKSGRPPAVVAQLAIVKALRLQQIVTGFAKDEHGTVHSLADVPRLRVLEETLAEILEQNSKVIVWARFKENYRQIYKICEKLKVQYAMLHGEVKDKDEEVSKFTKNHDCMVMVANQRAGGIGINLVEAPYSIYYSKDFSLESDIQSEGRNYRGGSEIHDKITRIDLVATDTIDELVDQALKSKLDIATVILDWKKQL